MSAEICLYGNHKTGAGWIAVFGSQTIGDGEPVKGRSFTEAVWMACSELERRGVRGEVTVFDAGGKRCATVSVHNPGYFGRFVWRPAPVLTISMEDILAAAEGVTRE